MKRLHVSEQGSTETSFETGMRRLTETNLLGLVFIDAAGTIRKADQSFLNTVGYSERDLPETLFEVTVPEDHRLVEEACEKLMAFGACAPFEHELVRKDGTHVSVLFGAALEEDE